MKQKTREPQYQSTIEIFEKQGLTSLGLMTNQVWHDDPRRLLFVLSRYKFISKMMSGLSHVLEIGCADAWGTRIVLQEVKKLTAVDFDPVFIEDAQRRMESNWKFKCQVHDMLTGPVSGKFDAAYSLDVIEHIRKKDEKRFLKNIVQSLTPEGFLIIGTPTLESQQYASPPSKIGHINCKKAPELKALLQQFFHNVFIFSMNDEVIHTGFTPMAHYLLAVCANRKNA